MSKAPKFTAKQAAFIREYLVDLNATQAAIRAGYSERTAGRTGHENLKKPEIAAAIQKAQEQRAQKLEITAEEVLTNLRLIALGEASFDTVNGLGILVTHQPRYADRLKAWELIGKHLGMFTERVDVTSDGKPLNIRVEYVDHAAESDS